MGRRFPLTALVVFLVLHFASGCREVEREALTKLKQSFDDPASRLSSWKGQDCCQWKGVKCDNVSDHVVTLDLRNTLSQFVSEFDNMMNDSNALSAPGLDPSLIKLRKLTYLDLSGNDFRGSQIPEFVGLLKSLRYLNLSKYGFGGLVPPQLGNLTRLRALDLADYEAGVEWSIDDQGRPRRSLVASPTMVVKNLEWVSRLLDLEYLDMSVVDLSEANTTMKALNKLPLLSELRLRGCVLGNVHLSNAFWNLTDKSSFSNTLHHLDLSFNNLDGSLPLLFANLTSIESLNLYSNMFNGTIPL